MDAVMKEFDPSHRLQELETEWAAFQDGAASFNKNSRSVFSLVQLVFLGSTLFF